MNETLEHRRELLSTSFQELEGQFHFAKFKNTSDIEEIQAYISEAVEGNCEGLMIKTLREESYYDPGKRSYNWLKV